MVIRKKRVMHYKTPKVAIEHTGFYRYVLLYEAAFKLKNYSATTWSKRESSLRQFIAWCEARDIHTPDVVTKPILEGYQRHLYHREKAPHAYGGGKLSMVSQRHYLSSVQQFFKWLTKANHIPSNPASELELPKRAQVLPVVLGVDEVVTLLQQPDVHTPSGLRDRALLEVLYATGIRRSELCALNLADVNTVSHTVFVRCGKGQKDRLVPLGSHASAWVARYVAQSRPVLEGLASGSVLFLNDYGEAFRNTKLGDKVKRYMVNAGITQPGACHLLRHACATHMLEGGADIRYVQAMLGHADLKSTQIYTHVSIRALKEAHAHAHPLNRVIHGTDDR